MSKYTAEEKRLRKDTKRIEAIASRSIFHEQKQREKRLKEKAERLERERVEGGQSRGTKQKVYKN